MDQTRFERAARAIEKARRPGGALEPEAVFDNLAVEFLDETSSQCVIAQLGLERLSAQELGALEKLAASYTAQRPGVWERLIEAVRDERMRLDLLIAAQPAPGRLNSRPRVALVIYPQAMERSEIEAGFSSIRAAYHEVQGAIRDNTMDEETARALCHVLVLFARACRMAMRPLAERRPSRSQPPEDVRNLALSALRIDMRMRRHITDLQREIHQHIRPYWRQHPGLLLREVIVRVSQGLKPEERKKFEGACIELDRALEERSAVLARTLREQIEN